MMSPSMTAFLVVAACACVHALPVEDLNVNEYEALPDVPPEIARELPTMSALFNMAKTSPDALADLLRESELAAVAPVFDVPDFTVTANADALPIVVAHGMGDSCFNAGMKSVTQTAGAHVGVYSTCIPTGKNRIFDTINGFLLSMDNSVEVFAKAVRADPKLANGFNAFGLSQGNNVIRGYMTKYNDPPVHTFMSICGINAGVGAFPQCSPSIPVVGKVCEGLTEVLGKFAYMDFFQNHLFQADYFRDPSKLNTTAYLNNSELANWNNEHTINQGYKDNWAKTSSFVWVKGTKDTVVWPRDGEWWGAVDPQDPWKKTIPMKETRWYTEDLFGLQTADKAGKNHFESFAGQHIQFTQTELLAWLDQYFKAPSAAVQKERVVVADDALELILSEDWLAEVADTHYEDPKNGCASDEIKISIQGVKGDVCAPNCSLFKACPTDVPAGAAAKPQCALQDASTKKKYCALICTPGTSAEVLDAQCGTNASCKSIQTVGICTYDD